MDDMLLDQADPRAGKFRHPTVTAKGDPRAHVTLTRLKTLWFNTGSLCNIACDGCYIESSPTNDRLAYLTVDDVRRSLDEVDAGGFAVEEVGFTGGEPFMNRAFIAILEETLARGYRVLVLTNAMKPMRHQRAALTGLRAKYGDALAIRVSIDHYTPEGHEKVRGAETWRPMIEGLRWLAAEGFCLTVAGRTLWGEAAADMRRAYGDFFAREGIAVDAFDPAALILFPEMDPLRDVPEISTHCWSILGVDPAAIMCATSRMIIKRKGASATVVVPCTLLPYDPAFELGETLNSADRTVHLNHPFCAQFCVLGGASCSAS